MVKIYDSSEKNKSSKPKRVSLTKDDLETAFIDFKELDKYRWIVVSTRGGKDVQYMLICDDELAPKTVFWLNNFIYPDNENLTHVGTIIKSGNFGTLLQGLFSQNRAQFEKDLSSAKHGWFVINCNL